MSDPNFHWEPLAPGAVGELFQGLNIRWWIAGGWAIDLFLGRQTRVHGDIDVLILRRDQLALQEHLRGWELWAAHPPGTLVPWTHGEILPKEAHDIWCRKSSDAPWCLQIMIADTDANQDVEHWLFRRDPRISRPLDMLGGRTPDGLSFLCPEVQLLFKAKNPRDKDESDFAAALPHMSLDACQWLAWGLAMTRPPGCGWEELVRESIEKKGAKKRAEICNTMARAAFHGENSLLQRLIHEVGVELNERIPLCTPELEADFILQEANLGYVTATFLILAIYGKQIDTVRLLLEAGCDPDATRAEDEKAALHVAAAVGSDDMVKLLLDAGAAVDMPEGNGALPLASACFYGHLKSINLLIAAKSPLQRKSKADSSPPLNAAVSGNQLAVAKFLLESGADPNVRSDQGVTPLMLAAQKRQLEMVELLLAYKANPNLVSRRERDTALIVSSYGMPPVLEIVEALLNSGADPDIQDSRNKTAVDWAREWHNEQVVELIERYRRRRGTRD